MPEAPDLEVVKDFLRQRVTGLKIEAGRVLRPSVVRSLAGDLASDVEGRSLQEFRRRGKFLLVDLSGDRVLCVNPMLTGLFQYCRSSEKATKRTCVALSLDNGWDLRYLDEKQMGMVYYVETGQLSQVPRLNDQGPDVLEKITFEEFQRGLKAFHGEIKGILTRGQFISGIGNAYADEILFEAKIYPFTRRKSLTQEELRRLYRSSHDVVENAIGVLRRRMGDKIHVKIRDFLQVHNKGGSPCPRCGTTISQLTANRRITSYCRRCQPGMLIRN